jgi:uncharacterized membrane protein
VNTIGLLDLVTLVSALGCGLVAGVLFAFSTSVMKALGALPPAQGMAAMQSISEVIVNPWFLTPFLGTALTCLLAILASLRRWPDTGSTYALVGGVLYVVGTIVVTMLFNVPLNNALAAVAPSHADAAALWARYLSSWTAWNHVRTAAAFGAAVLFTIALTINVPTRMP